MQHIPDRLLVRDVMTDRVIHASVNEDLLTIYDLMSEHQVRHLPVVNPEGDLIGVVSYENLMNATLDGVMDLPIAERDQFLRQKRVNEIMSTGVETVESGEDAAEAGRTMLELKLSCLPVVEGGRLVGILTEADFVRHVVETDTAQAEGESQPRRRSRKPAKVQHERRVG